jgi:hypothetical protein
VHPAGSPPDLAPQIKVLEVLIVCTFRVTNKLLAETRTTVSHGKIHDQIANELEDSDWGSANHI